MTSSSANEDDNVKRIVFLGAGQVGKTSLIRRFIDNTFAEKYRATVEDLFHRKYEINDVPMEVEFMDTSGSFNFPAMRRISIAKATAFVLVFSLDNSYSLEFLEGIIDQIREERSDHETTPLMIVANKLDIRRSDRQLCDEEIDAWMDERGLTCASLMYTSAKEEDGVWQLFTRIWEQHRDFKAEKEDSCPVVAPPPPELLGKRRFSAFAVLTGIQGFNVKSLTSDNSSPAKSLKKRNSRSSMSKINGRSAKDVVRVDCVIS